ncbi:MAG TPA: hypothetical protein VFX55_16165 [Duganella sp.]|nr:hypothetical protein [Duganella sp.]
MQSLSLEQHCKHCLDGGGTFHQLDLLLQIQAANRAGLPKAAIITLLNQVLIRLEAEQRHAEFEAVAELVQRITGFFSPGGVIPLEDH